MAVDVEFSAQVLDAYEHLYDLVYLRTHPLADALISDPSLSRKEKAWRLHQALLNFVEDLDPGPQAPTFSRERRRHRAMVLRYVQGLDPQSVADQLAISRRHFYRLQDAAIEAIAQIVRQRCATQGVTLQHNEQPSTERDECSELGLLRLEAARLAQADRYARVSDVIHGVRSVLEERLGECGLDVELALPESLPGVAANPSLLRQVLLGILGYVVEHAQRATIHLSAQVEGESVRLSLRLDPPTSIEGAVPADIQRHLAAFEEIASQNNIRILTVHAAETIVGFDVGVPALERTVLVVDDSEDALSLFQRYLSPHHYRVVTAQTVGEALEMARTTLPYAIILDLMMPEQDGWDLLQILLNRPDTRDIPLIVCSVLKQQRELALSLGASAFVSKPVNEELLLSALAAMDSE